MLGGYNLRPECAGSADVYRNRRFATECGIRAEGFRTVHVAKCLHCRISESKLPEERRG